MKPVYSNETTEIKGFGVMMSTETTYQSYKEWRQSPPETKDIAKSS